jgi:hypothetical protein
MMIIQHLRREKVLKRTVARSAVDLLLKEMVLQQIYTLSRSIV